MYYIQSYIDSGSFAYPAKKGDRSDQFYSLFDAIDELRDWGKRIADEHDEDYGEAIDYDIDDLGLSVYIGDKYIFLKIIHHDSKTNKDYVVPNLEKIIDEHDKTAEALNQHKGDFQNDVLHTNLLQRLDPRAKKRKAQRVVHDNF